MDGNPFEISMLVREKYSLSGIGSCRNLWLICDLKPFMEARCGVSQPACCGLNQPTARRCPLERFSFACINAEPPVAGNRERFVSVVSASRRPSVEKCVTPDTTYYTEAKTALELHAKTKLEHPATRDVRRHAVRGAQRRIAALNRRHVHQVVHFEHGLDRPVLPPEDLPEADVHQCQAGRASLTARLNLDGLVHLRQRNGIARDLNSRGLGRSGVILHVSRDHDS